MELTTAVRELYVNYINKFRRNKPRLELPLEEQHPTEPCSDNNNEDTSVPSRHIETPNSEIVFPSLLYNSIAISDLQLDTLIGEILNLIPHRKFVENQEGYTSDYVWRQFRNPPSMKGSIQALQDIFEDLTFNQSLRRQVEEAKLAADRYKWDERTIWANEKIFSIYRAVQLVNLVDALANFDNPHSKRLYDLSEWAGSIAATQDFQRVKQFVDVIYIPYELPKHLSFLVGNVSEYERLDEVKDRRQFYRSTKLLEEITARLVEEEQFDGFLNKEIKEVGLLDTLRDKVNFFNSMVFKFVPEHHSGISDNKFRAFGKFMEYWMDLVHEAIYSRLPEAEIGELPEELGYYLGIAGIQNKWIQNGAKLTRPAFNEPSSKKAEFNDAYNITLLTRRPIDEIKPNDIISDRDTNVFVISGPNNGGKTTYLRQVGQLYWAAHMGMWLPAESAQLPIVDGIYTSFQHRDNTNEGEGLYRAELRSVGNFLNGENVASPYSLVLLDEFANGTDHEESVRRTRIVLEHLSQKGITAYFTTHKPEIADVVEAGEIPGAMNLAVGVHHRDGTMNLTHKIIRDAREKSYGYVHAEELGITEEGLHRRLLGEVNRGLYPIADTRLPSVSKLDGHLTDKPVGIRAA